MNRPASKINHHGIFLLNKPLGISSNDALQIVKHWFHAKKAGHAGTLDPLACGLLLVLLGEATKFAQILLNEDKTYETIARLGITTQTGDIEGKVISEKPVPDLNRQQVLAVLQKFQGVIEQQPSIYSALKHHGRPLYALARKNLETPIKKKLVYVKQIELLKLEKEYLTLSVRCSKGTYIRTLVEDIGHALGCGAHCFYLKRTGIDHYQLSDAHSFFDLKKSSNPMDLILPLTDLVSPDKKTFVSEAAAYYLLQGQSIIYPWPLPSSSEQDLLYLYLKDGQFLGVGKVLPDERVAPVRLVDPSVLQ